MDITTKILYTSLLVMAICIFWVKFRDGCSVPYTEMALVVVVLFCSALACIVTVLIKIWL